MDLLDEAADLHSEEILIPDIQLLRGLVIGMYLEDRKDGHVPGDLEMGGIHQNRRILGYLNNLEDKLLKGEKV